MSNVSNFLNEIGRGSDAPSDSVKEVNNTQPLSEFKWLDGDTLVSLDGVKHRVQGFDTPEIGKFITDEEGNYKYKAGTTGGLAAAETIRDLATKTGYTNVRVLDEDAAYGRKTIVLLNDRGENFTDRLIKEGTLDPVEQTDPKLIMDKAYNDLLGFTGTREDSDEFSKAAQVMKDAAIAEGYDSSRFKLIAANEAALQQGRGIEGLYNEDTVQFRNLDRTLDNKSLNPFSDAWDSGVTSMIQSAYGTASLVGDVFGLEDLKEFGDAGTYRQGVELSNMANILLDYKDVDSFGDAVDFLGNNFAMSLPYMGMLIASGAAAGVTGGASLAVMPGIYSGQVWNEQPEDSKNAAHAIGAGLLMSALDRLGLKGAIKNTSAAPKKLLEEAIEANAKKLAGTDTVTDAIRAQAKDQVLNMTKMQIGSLGKDVVDVMSNQLKSKDAVMGMLKGVGKGTAFEGTTEALQESIGYVGANLESGAIDFTEMGDRAIAAAIAGGAIGGGLGAGGAAIDYAKWADVAWRKAPAMEMDKAEADKYADMEIQERGYIRSVQDIAEDTNRELKEENKEAYVQIKGIKSKISDLESQYEAGFISFSKYEEEKKALDKQAADIDSKYNLNVMNDRYEKAYKDKTTKDKIFDALNRIPELWRNQIKSVIPADMQAKAVELRELADMFGGNLNRVFSGASFENRKHHIVSIFKGISPDPTETYTVLNNGKRATRKEKQQISQRVYAILQAATNEKTGKFDPRMVPKDIEHREVITTLGMKLQKLADKMHEGQSKFADIGKVSNYLAKFKTLDKNAVASDKVGFMKLLQKHYDMSEADAKKVTDEIIYNNEIATVDEAMDVEGEFNAVSGGFKPGSHKKRTLGLSENPEFQQFMEQDIFANVSYAAKSAGRYIANQEMVGFNGNVIAKKLMDAVDKGSITQEEADRIAYGLTNYLNAEAGNYKRPTTETGKKLQEIQRNFIFFTTIAGLPLATISSIVEMALTLTALTPEQIFGSKGKEGGLKKMGKEFAAMLMQGTQEVGSEVGSFGLGAKVDFNKKRTAAQIRMQDLGFYDWDIGAATKTGVTETSALKQRFIELFFKYNGLQGFTQMTRAVRTSIAGDYIFDKLDDILTADLEGGPLDKGTLESIRHLRDLGMDVNMTSLKQLKDIMTKHQVGVELSPEEDAFLDKQLREATYSFVNQAIMLPSAANRPLWLQDPRFALFNQFQGFISTFTSTYIPRLWGEYVKRGSPAMKYNAFATMATMILLGFVSQEIKDQLKYGETSPYLDEAEWLRRGISSSGLLGSSERVINTLYPMYETRSDGVFEWAWNEASGQSPAIGSMASGIGGVGNIIEGETTRGMDKLLRLTPVGPITWFRKDLAEVLGGE